MAAKTGFIGLGTMGLPMAKCLQRTGMEVVGWDLSPGAMSAFDPVADSLAGIAASCEVFITMLPQGEHVAEVHAQLLDAGVGVGSLFIDCSTIDVTTTRELAAGLAERGHGFVDAPVSGGAEGAAVGSLSFMLGGSAAEVARARPLLEVMGSKLNEFGEAGAGQAAKACHNMICGVTALGVCEAFALADALDLDLRNFFQLCRGAAAQSWILENRCPVPGPAPDAPASNDYAPGFAARLMAKDLGLAQQAAVSSGQATEFGALAAQRFREFVESADGDLDFSSIYRSIRK
jgi:3-hydroxyisobutyrate dehydrogenase